jgi:protein gp37
LPHLVFVNSMSDLFHDDIPDAFRDKVFDAMENVPTASAVFQILTKRHMTMRRYIERRYHGIPIPRHIWLGVSCEDNRVRGRLDALRRMKDAMGDFTAFVSVEPLIGAVDKHDYSGLDWILIGGESGPECRDCWPEWAFTSIDLARKAKAAVWGKQWGHWRNNPLYRTAAQALGEKAKHVDKVRHAIDHGEKEAAVEMVSGKVMVTGEKGGATFRGDVLHELPPWYANLKAILSAETQGKQAAKVGGMFAQALR